MFAKVLAIVAAGTSVVSATCTYPPPLANQLPGNSVTRPDLNDPATIGQAFNIIWDATGLPGTVSLILLQGPSNNIQYLETIVSGAPNTGSYSWTPESSLTPATTGYGLMLLDDDTCQFQWSTQFGINAGSGDTPPPKSSSSAPPPSSTSKPPPASSTTSKAPEGSSSAPPPPPKTWTTSAGGSWGSNGTHGSTSTSTYWLPAGTGGAPAPSSTYKPAQSNDGARFGMSLFGAAAALAAAVMIC